MRIAFDFSNYDADILEPGRIACLRAAGMEAAIVGCQRPDVARQQILALQRARIPVVGVYAFLYFGQDSAGQAANAVQVARACDVGTVWLDVEATPPNEAPGMTPAGRIAELANCVAIVRAGGKRPGIYTGAWYWPHQMANSTQFADLPLWHAEYPADGHAVRAVAYGGWSRVAIHQFASAPAYCGRARDRNYLFEEEDAMTPEELARLERLERLVAGNGYQQGAMRLTGEAAMAAADADGGSLFLGLGQTQARVAEHVANHAAGVNGGIAEHTHIQGGVKR